jgi:hypothetical protein
MSSAARFAFIFSLLSYLSDNKIPVLPKTGFFPYHASFSTLPVAETDSKGRKSNKKETKLAGLMGRGAGP